LCIGGAGGETCRLVADTSAPRRTRGGVD
jgi:hypothetical protein